MASYRVDRAAHGDLLLFCQEQNLDIPDHPTKEQLRALIRASGHTGQTFELDDAAHRPSAGTLAAAAARGKDNDYTHVKLTIAFGEGIEGQDKVWLSVNGRGMWVPRGEPVVIPRLYYEGSLMNAVELIYPETPNPKNPEESALAHPMERTRFPHQVHEKINDPERAAKEHAARRTASRQAA